MNTYIYALIDPRDGLIKYIGKTNNIENRKRSHFCELGKTPKCYWVQKLLREGLEPELIVLDEIHIDEWRFWETYWYWQAKSWGYTLKNSDPPGNGTSTLTKEQRADRSLQLKNRSYEERYGEEKAKLIGDKISKVKKGKPDEYKKAIAKKYHNKINSIPGYRDEINQKISDIKTGYIMSDENKQKISIGLKNSDKHKESMFNRESGGVNNSRYAGIIYQYNKEKTELIKEWEGLHELKKAGFNLGNISSCCNGKLKTANGFYWTRETIQLSVDF